MIAPSDGKLVQLAAKYPCEVEVARGETRKQVLDLRPFETLRGVTPSEGQPLPSPPKLDRANLLLTVQLPIGSYEGRYLFTVVDSDQKARLETPAIAVMR